MTKWFQKGRPATGVLGLLRWVFLATAVVLLAASALTWRSSRAFLASAETVQGTVIDLDWSANRNRGGTFHPVVRFVTHDGEQVEFRSNWGASPAPYRRGESVTVLYAPDDPRQARIEAFFPLWGATLICGLLGTIFLVVAVVLFLVMRARRDAAPASGGRPSRSRRKLTAPGR